MASRVAVLLLLFFMSISPGAWAQTAATRGRATTNSAINAVASHSPADAIRIVAGDVDSTSLRVANDVARVMDDNSGLRIIPIVGKGSLVNLNDLVTQKTVDIAIMQSDVMARYSVKNKNAAADAQLQYISKLYSEEFHVLARMQFLCLQDLSGRRVSFGPKDSGMAITAEAVFDAHNISVEPLYLDLETGLEQLKRGELDAVIYVSGKPARTFDRISYKDRVHFLDIDYSPKLQANYLPSILTAEDYPNLIAPNESVSTVGVTSVMAVLNTPPQSDKFRTLSKFSEKFMQSVDALKQGAYTAKWKEVNVAAPLKGWQRFHPAEKWLLANVLAGKTPNSQQLAAPQVKAMLQKFVESQRGTSTDQEELFNQFVLWYQSQSAQQQ